MTHTTEAVKEIKESAQGNMDLSDEQLSGVSGGNPFALGFAVAVLAVKGLRALKLHELYKR